jgi:hypothetical protein
VFESEEYERQPGEAGGDGVAGEEQVRHPLRRQHEPDRRDQRPEFAEPVPPGVHEREHPRGQDVQGDHPTERGPQRRLGHEVGHRVRRVDGADLHVVDERGAAEVVRVPPRQLAGVAPLAVEEDPGGQVLGEEVGVVGVEDPPGVQHQRVEERRPQQHEHDVRTEPGGHVGGSGIGGGMGLRH